MKAISVAAPCNGSGKTSLILAILKTFPETFAVTKFTTIYREEQFCPAKDHDCACHRLKGDYAICSDPEVLSQPDTDTGKIWSAGALQTLWCVARPEGYLQMVLEYLARHLVPGVPLLMEGNTVAQYLESHVRLFVVNPKLPDSWWKDDAEQLMQAADFVLVNPFSAEDGNSGREDRLSQWKDTRVYTAIARLLASG
jgi:hypothetical protein